MQREIVFDLSHLITRLNQLATSGMDRVDLAYARYFAAKSTRAAAGTQYGLFRPHVVSQVRMQSLIECFERRQLERETGDGLEWLTAKAQLAGLGGALTAPRWARLLDRIRGFAIQSGFRVFHQWGRELPHGAIYLNVAQHAFEHHRFFNWLDRRPDVLPVFLVHDMLALDFPEFFPAGYDRRFQRRVDLIIRRARAIITTTEQVAQRVRLEYFRRSLDPVPIHVEALASALEGAPDAGDGDAILADAGYFLSVATIEPRKNHMLLIQIWRSLIQRGRPPPKLVLVGRRGWESEQTFRELDLAPDLRPHVIEIPRLSSHHLRLLMKHARAVLMPSFAEGYGIPIVEALSLGTPVICSDIPVFRDVSQNKALFRSPIDGTGWLAAVDAMTDHGSALRDEYARKAREFRAPTWQGYFDNVVNFLSRL